MKITKINLVGFRNYLNETIEFGPKMNIFIGDNVLIGPNVNIITDYKSNYDLSNIKDETLLYQKWDEYTKQVIMSINKKYNYQATYSEYQEYYDEYEHYLLSKEKENEN